MEDDAFWGVIVGWSRTTSRAMSIRSMAVQFWGNRNKEPDSANEEGGGSFRDMCRIVPAGPASLESHNEDDDI